MKAQASRHQTGKAVMARQCPYSLASPPGRTHWQIDLPRQHPDACRDVEHEHTVGKGLAAVMITGKVQLAAAHPGVDQISSAVYRPCIHTLAVSAVL